MKKKWYSGKGTLLVFTTAFIALASCGENSGANKSVQSGQQQEQDSGSFKAELTPLNAQVSGGISGTADVTVNGDGLIDGPETNAVSGNVLIPFDSDIIGFDGARVVEIHGVAANAILPDSVASADPNKSPEELPIACGVLRRSGGTTGGGQGCNGGKC